MNDPLSPENHKQFLVEHYASLGLQPGWLDYVRDRVRQLQRSNASYADLGMLVKNRMDEIYCPVKHDDRS